MLVLSSRFSHLPWLLSLGGIKDMQFVTPKFEKF